MKYTVPAYRRSDVPSDLNNGRIFCAENTKRKDLKKWEERLYGIFQQCSNCITDTCGSSWSGNDNPGAKSQGMKQLMAGGGVALIGITLVPLLSGLFG